ncbi:hypothetical protein EYR40_008368 [Pleurotus pulmonarius]|nr:hypothetical protein EYR40_008368 [Pleurotus pulmonarius]
MELSRTARVGTDFSWTMTERGYVNLNQSVLRQISKALEHDSASDIESVLKRVYISYASLRQKICERQTKRHKLNNSAKQDSKKHLSFPGVLLSLATFIERPRIASGPLEQLRLPPPIPHSIVCPLKPEVCALLDVVDGQASNFASGLLRCILSGSSVWEDRSRAVIQIGDGVVVKVAEGLEHEEHGILQFVEKHIPSVIAPRPLGFVSLGSVGLMFMTQIPGVTLEARWPTLTTEQRADVRQLLDDSLRVLRSFKLSENSPLGSPVGQRLCKDVRRDERVSASPIYSEDEFNDFLLNPPTSRAATGYKKWLRSMLRSDHQIVFSHADFHPRNIMVVDAPGGLIQLSGILDWEASGFYPEYWELLKAMNTRSVRDDNTWWDHLPQCILGYDAEVVVDRVVESTVIY